MSLSKTLMAVCVASALVAGCKKQDDAAEPQVETAPAVSETAAEPTPEVAPAEPAQPQAAPAKAFDINAIAVSDKPLGEWPYIALPAGYRYYHDGALAGQSKDLAQAAVWTGGQLLWVEGKTFSDQINNADGKTYSKFELRKSLQQAVEGLGGVRLTERTFDEATYRANEKALEDFRQEFTNVQNAYWYDGDADTYVIRRADKAIWVVVQSGNNQGGVLVAEGPLPTPPAQ